MRRIAAVVIGATCFVALAAPAQAVTETSRSAVVNVYWNTREPLTSNTYRQTTWYVGAYVDTEYGISSDGYQQVSTCVVLDRRQVRCRQDSFKVGYSHLNGQGEYFKIDGDTLTYANLRGVYPLQTMDENGDPVWPVEWTVITADLTGVGDLTRSRDTYSHHSRECFTRTTSDSAQRDFDAIGTLNGDPLGHTSTGILSSSKSTTVTYGDCGYGG